MIRKFFNQKLKQEDGKMPESTWDCHLNEFNLPKAPFVCSEKVLNTWKDVEEFVSTHIKDYPFVKTCEFSPKDWIDPPVFQSVENAMIALKNSNRTVLGRHIVMKKERKYISQARCFWAQDKLRVVCGNMNHDLVLEFFKRFEYDIPFHYCCVELGEYECSQNSNSTVEMIEINTFSELCDPTPLDWSQDWNTLFFAETVCWCDV